MKKKSHKKDDPQKSTWGHVTPGSLSEQDAKGLKAAMENAKKNGTHSPDMDPDDDETKKMQGSRKREHGWQKLDEDEKERSRHRKGGYPKN